MNCKELMIGNFARVTKDVCFKKGTIVEIRGIDADNALPEKGLKGGATCVAVDDPYRIQGGVWLDFLEPIPLTETILKKNGFENNFSADGVVYVCEVYKLQLLQRKNDEGWTIYANHFGFDKKELFVHEFQNALNLCGIEKKIKL